MVHIVTACHGSRHGVIRAHVPVVVDPLRAKASQGQAAGSRQPQAAVWLQRIPQGEMYCSTKPARPCNGQIHASMLQVC